VRHSDWTIPLANVDRIRARTICAEHVAVDTHDSGGCKGNWVKSSWTSRGCLSVERIVMGSVGVTDQESIQCKDLVDVTSENVTGKIVSLY
jgi:hypothetical protein